MAEISEDLREASVLLVWSSVIKFRKRKVFCSRNLKNFKRFQSGRCALNKKDNRIQFEFGTILKALFNSDIPDRQAFVATLFLTPGSKAAPLKGHL